MAKKVKLTDRQVSAWLYMIVGPVIDGLTQESYFLNVQKNPTWRYETGVCEFVHPIAEYIDASQKPTLGQFLRFNSREGKLIEAHDEALGAVEASAVKAHAALVALPAFRSLVDRIELEFKNWRGAGGIEEGPRILAQCVIDWANTPEPAPHYTHAVVWTEHGSEALRLREDPAVVAAFERLDADLGRLTKSCNKLRTALEERRDELADQHGLPPAAPTTADVLRLESDEKF